MEESAILTHDKVRQLRGEYATGTTTVRRLSDKYGVSLRSVYRVVRRETYRQVIGVYVPPPPADSDITLYREEKAKREAARRDADRAALERARAVFEGEEKKRRFVGGAL